MLSFPQTYAEVPISNVTLFACLLAYFESTRSLGSQMLLLWASGREQKGARFCRIISTTTRKKVSGF